MSQMMEMPSDGDLFARAKAGDQLAWEELFRTCYPKVVRVVRRKLGGPMRKLYDSIDFASDVWVSLAAKADRFDFPSVEALMAFLAQAAEKKVIDEYRKQHTQKRDITLEERLEAAPGDGAPRALRSSEPPPSQVALANEGFERLLADLSAAEREVLHLRRQGYSNEEIAGRTGWDLRKVQRFLKGLRDSRLDGGALS